MSADRRRFRLSAEAKRLLAEESSRWERVELDDGPAAQSYIGGGGWSPTPAPARDEPDPEPEDGPDPDQGELL